MASKVNLRSFKGIMRSKIAGIPVPILAAGIGVVAVIFLRKKAAAEGKAVADQGNAGEPGTSTGSYDQGGGGGFSGGGFGYDQGGYYSPYPVDLGRGGGELGGPTGIATRGRGRAPRNAARIGALKQRRAFVSGRLTQARAQGKTKQVQHLQGHKRAITRNIRQSRRRMLGGKTTTTGA